MSVIRVDPASVVQYGRDAQAAMDEIHLALTGLVDDVVAVRYRGPNSVVFRSECARLAVDHAARLHHDIASMAEAVRVSTSNIAVALGGQPIHIAVDSRPIVSPTPDVVDHVDVDTTALEGLLPVVAARFETMRVQLDANLRRLTATDWEGNAKRTAVDTVTALTASARRSCTDSEEAIVTAVRRQLDVVLAADR